MDQRVQRLKKLLALQEQLKALHELRHAGHVAEAVAARREAVEIVDRFNADQTMPTLFPEVYHSRIAQALSREGTSLAQAAGEAAKVAAATARTNMVERTYREARAADERQRDDSDRLEMIGQRLRPAGK